MADFIITSLQSWDIEIGSTIKNTASEIAKKHRVLYLNPPMDIATRLRIAAGKGPLSPTGHRQLEVIQSKSAPLRQINENLWVLDCPFIIHSVGQLPTWLFNCLNRRNCKKIGNWIVQQADVLGFKDYTHLIDTDLSEACISKNISARQSAFIIGATMLSAFPIGASTDHVAKKCLYVSQISYWQIPVTLQNNSDL